jgi:predicted transcriptional regulator of viral defense system
MKQRLGKMEQQLFGYAHLRGLSVIRTGDLTEALRVSNKQVRELLSRLSRAGMIAKVQRGLYLIPPRLPLGGAWSPDPFLALNALMAAQTGRYQVCGPNAFNRYGYDEQVPVRVYAYNNRISGDRKIGSVELTLIKVADSRLGGTEEVTNADGQRAAYSSPARTLVDAVYDWSRFDSLPRGYDWIRRELTSRRVSARELVGMTLEFGNIGTIRRVGCLLESLRVKDSLLKRMERRLPQSSAYIPWIPSYPKRGKLSRRWGVVINGEI